MQRLSSPIQLIKPIITLSSKPHFKFTQFSTSSSSSSNNDNNKEWNDAWETAWLPAEDLKTPPAPWDSDVNFGLIPDPDTKAFINDMNDNWGTRQGRSNSKNNKKNDDGDKDVGLYRLENVKRDYRVNKQRVHASLWLNEIHNLNRDAGCADDIDKLLDSCSQIFDSPSNDFNDPKVSSTSELKNKPDGWETTAKSEDGNVWEMSQREEDILLQEFERRMAFCKFQIASFIKTHIFSRRRPIDGWKYMIEVIGPNARKGKGSVSRLPGLADPATQPFTEERTPASRGRSTSRRSR